MTVSGSELRDIASAVIGHDVLANALKIIRESSNAPVGDLTLALAVDLLPECAAVLLLEHSGEESTQLTEVHVKLSDEIDIPLRETGVFARTVSASNEKLVSAATLQTLSELSAVHSVLLQSEESGLTPTEIGIQPLGFIANLQNLRNSEGSGKGLLRRLKSKFLGASFNDH